MPLICTGSETFHMRRRVAIKLCPDDTSANGPGVTTTGGGNVVEVNVAETPFTVTVVEFAAL